MKYKKFLKVFLAGVISGMTAMVVIIAAMSFTGVMDIQAAFEDNSVNESLLAQTVKSKANTIMAYINQYYLDDIDDTTMADSIYKGIVNGLGDDYAAYYTSDEYTSITEKSSGVYCGIGAYVTSDATTGAITIVKPIEDGPADKAGVKAGDIIYAVDGEEVTGQDLSSVLAKVKGESGTKVDLKIIRDGENDYLDIEVVRESIEEDTVAYKMLDNNIGYIAVSGFEEVTADQFKDAVDDLEKQGEKSLIIDLRDNGGGLLSSAVTMLDRLLPKEMVVYTKDNQGTAQEYYAEDNEKIDVPVAILVNGNSASASEVFSGALQDYGVAKLVGTTTFGKGIVQTIFNLQDGTALKMTTAKYYTPNGRNIHGTGLTPDIEVELDDTNSVQSGSGVTVDNQMQAAIDYLQK